MALHGQDAQATAISGQGTWETTLQGRDLDGNTGNGFEAYFDTTLNITWLRDTAYIRTSGASNRQEVSWTAANTWATGLSVGGIAGWRLPTVKPVNGTAFNFTNSSDGTTDVGASITSPQSELAHMINVTLGNVGNVGNAPFNSGAFDNVTAFSRLWSGTRATVGTEGLQKFFFYNTSIGQSQALGFNEMLAWAVRDGDIGLLLPSQWLSSSSGSWDTASNWNLAPGSTSANAITIDPTRTLTVTGPAANTSFRNLIVGGDGSGNLGIATLNLIGSRLTATQDISVGRQGILTGDGTLAGVNVFNQGLIQGSNVAIIASTLFHNQGTLNGSRLQISSPTSINTGWLNVADATFGGTLINQGSIQVNQLKVTNGLKNEGTVLGHGQFTGSLTNQSGGMVLANFGSRLVVTGSVINQSGGLVDLNGGNVQVSSEVHNQSGARIVLGQGSRLAASGGLSNQGQVLMSSGSADVHGAVTNQAGGQIIASGNGNITFYGDTELQAGSELRVAQGSSVTFFGHVEQRTGANFTGSGSKFFEGGLSVGASPGLGAIAGDVGFGLDNELLIELGGDSACTLACATDNALKDSSHDKLAVGGTLTLGGTLRLVSWNSFVAQAGMRFDVLDWGRLEGTFDSIDTTAFLLASNTRLDLSKLYVDGSVSVLSTTTAVPEPQTWALAMAGVFICLLGTSRKRPV